MEVALLFWLALLLPGYVLVRLVAPDGLKSGLLGTVGLSYVAALGVLSPVSILCYALRLPVAVFSGACVLVVLAAILHLTRRRWWGDVGKLLVTGISIELLIVVLDMIVGGRVGAYLYGGDERLHIARIRFLLDHGVSNNDPFIAGRFFFPIYHTNLLHTLYAACTQLTRVDFLGVWYVSLVWAKLLIAAGYYYMAWSVFERRWVAWVIALFAVGWLAPMTYVVYPNQLAPHWLIPMMIGFAVQACRSTCPWRVSIQLASGSLLLGQVHSLYAVFAGVALGPVLACLFLVRLLRRRADRWRLAACVAALFLAAPFAVIAKTKMASPSSKQPAPIESTARFHHWENGWAMFRPGFLRGSRGLVTGGLAAMGITCAMISRRRKQAGVLIAITASVAAVLFIPPLCGAMIRAFGKEWIAARLGSLFLIGLMGLTLGGIACLVERRLRWWWLRSLVSVGAVFLGGQFATSKPPCDWSDYYNTMKASAGFRHRMIDRWRRLRVFCQHHIPAGETVLAYPQTELWLVMVHDCHVLSIRRGGGVSDAGRHQRDGRAMLSQRTPWETRRELLREYGINLLMLDTQFYAPELILWTKGHLKAQPRQMDSFVLVSLDTT